MSYHRGKKPICRAFRQMVDCQTAGTVHHGNLPIPEGNPRG